MTRGTTVGAAELAGALVGALAGATLVVLAVLVVSRRGAPHDRTVRLLWTVATATAAAEVLVLVATAQAPRRALAVGARLLVLAAGAVVARRDRLPPSGERGRHASAIPVGGAVLAVLAVPLAAPGAGTPGGLARAGAVTAGGVAAATATVLLARRRPRVLATTSLLLVTVLAAATAWALLPTGPPPYRLERVVADDVTLDVTVAPVAAGTNEIHVYAFDDAGDEVALDEVHVGVVDHPGSEHTMLRVGPNHHLSYVLELPETSGWELELLAHRPTGGQVRTTLRLERP